MFGRLSLGQALPGKKSEIVRLYTDLDEALRARKGYVASFVFVDSLYPNEVGRFAIWRTSADIDLAAQEERIVALRSQIHQLLQPGHIEKIVEVEMSPGSTLKLS